MAEGERIMDWPEVCTMLLRRDLTSVRAYSMESLVDDALKEATRSWAEVLVFEFPGRTVQIEASGGYDGLGEMQAKEVLDT